jgi:glycosyltransferase involved in cell wall biosynthesis
MYPSISVVIPTFNREKMLSITVDSFLNQSYPKDRYEIIISNNNSTDKTQDVIDKYKRNGNVKSIVEKRQGVHYARNSAAKISQGDYLYYTDDDMIADKNLLKNLVQVFLDDPNIASATGKVLPKWEVQPPKWVSDNLLNGMLSLNDLGDSTIISDKDIGVFSCHQMIKRDIFFKSGGFNPENTAGKWIGDGETGLNIKIKELNGKFAYVGTSVIWHMIPPSRMTQRYLDKRIGNQGNCDSYTDYKKHKYKKIVLLKLSIKYCFHALICALRYLKGFYKLEKVFTIRLHRAYFFYFFNRVKYNIKLILSKHWRNLVLQYDWLNECF